LNMQAGGLQASTNREKTERRRKGIIRLGPRVVNARTMREGTPPRVASMGGTSEKLGFKGKKSGRASGIREEEEKRGNNKTETIPHPRRTGVDGNRSAIRKNGEGKKRKEETRCGQEEKKRCTRERKKRASVP